MHISVSIKFGPRPPHLLPRDVPPLPPELWMYIAEFLPLDDLKKLRDYNTEFREVALQREHHQLRVLSYNNLLKDIFVIREEGAGRFVRSLTLSPTAVWEGLRWQPPEVPEQTPTIWSWNFIRSLWGSAPPPGAEFSETVRRDVLLSVLSTFTGVKDLVIDWSDSENPLHYQPRIPAAQQMISLLPLSTLQSLTLRVTWDRLPSILPKPTELADSGWFKTLYSLTLSPYYPPGMTEQQISAVNSFVTVDLPQFVNALGTTLRALALEPIGHHDFSLMLEVIDLPQLTHLTIGAPLDPTHLPRSHCLSDLIHRHSNFLQYLTLIHRNCCAQGEVSTWHYLWLEELGRLEAGSKGSALQTLHLRLDAGTRATSRLPWPRPPSSEGFCSILRDELATGFPHVNILKVSDWHMDFVEVQKLVRPASRNIGQVSPGNSTPGAWQLVDLDLHVKKISPELMLLLATNCRDLKKLQLRVDAYVTNETGEHVQAQLKNRINRHASAFIKSLERHADVLRQWRIEDVAIWNWVAFYGLQRNWVCMQGLREIIPSIRSFAGRGHCDIPFDDD